MAILKFNEIKKMNEKDIEVKLKDLKLELVKSRTSSSKTGGSKTKEIKKIIARLNTVKPQEKIKTSSKKEVLKKK